MDRPMLRLSALRKSFGRTLAVDGLSLDVPRGTVFGVLGPNGAGKTTTINMGVGLLAPDSGSIDLDGLGPPTNPAVRAKIGVAPQSLALYDELTAAENLAVFARLYAISRTSSLARACEVLHKVGLTERAHDRVRAFSGGMKRRLNLAAALLHNPPLLILDEPTAGVDPQSRTAIIELVRDLRDRGTTVIYTTHYIEEAQRLCDHVAIVDHGRVLALGTVEGLIAAHGGRTIVTVQLAGSEQRVETDDPVAELSARLREPGVVGVRVERPDLESVFLHLTGRRLRD